MLAKDPLDGPREEPLPRAPASLEDQSNLCPLSRVLKAPRGPPQDVVEVIPVPVGEDIEHVVAHKRPCPLPRLDAPAAPEVHIAPYLLRSTRPKHETIILPALRVA